MNHDVAVPPQLPNLYAAADKASAVAQQRYLRIFLADLGLLAAGAALTTQSPFGMLAEDIARIAGAVLLTLSLLATILLTSRNYEQIWYGGRAAAESVKTLAWRYMMRAAPYSRDLSAREADQLFAGDIRTVLLEAHHPSFGFRLESSPAPQITADMQRIRGLDLAERKAVYEQYRLEDQRNWYANKATFNEKQERRGFYAVMFLQGVAAAYAIVLAALPAIETNLLGILSTMGAAFLAWMQVKRHQELAQAYAIAAHELSLAADLAQHATTEDQFTQFVVEAESAVSREHTLWIARRNAAATKLK
jgi:hypothetical protein